MRINQLSAIIIDNEQDVVAVLCEYLELQEVRVVGRGSDGKDAIELYQRYRPDVVFLDVIMPQYDGFYAIKIIKELNPESNIIVITAALFDPRISDLQKIPGIQIFEKPFELNRLNNSLATLKNHRLAGAREDARPNSL